MLEHTVLLHWVVERGDEGVQAVIANQSKRIKGWLKNAAGTSLSVSPGVVSELMSDLPGIDERKAVRTFQEICNQIDAQDLYAVYGIQSLFVHPTITTSNMYCDTSENDARLTLTPGGESGGANISMVAHYLIWAGRAFDRLTPGQPRREGLEKLAQAIEARPVLPAYHPTPASKRSNRGRSGRRRRRKR